LINNRQAGRRRGRGGQQQRPQGGSGRPDNGNRIDNRARGNAAQLLEKYKTLARDAQMQGDRVNVEYYLQFADHYFRVLAETRARFEENGGQPSGRRIQGATLDEDEQDFEDEAATEQRGQHGNPQNGQQRHEGRGERDGNRQNGEPREAGEGGESGDRPRRMNGNHDGGYERQPREERGERPQRNNRGERDAAPAVQEGEVVAPSETPMAVQPEAAPKRGRGRPRREAAPVVEDVDGEADTGFLASLPPALNVSAVAVPEADNDAEVAGKPRRRRGRPPASAADAG
jgi:hypothetical protein